LAALLLSVMTPVMTLWSIKRCHFVSDYNSHIFLVDFFYNFSTSGNRNELLYGGITKCTTYSSCVSALPVKTKPHKQRILKSVVTVFHYSTEEWVCVWDKGAVFLQEAFKMSALLGNSFSSLLAKNILHSQRFSIKILSSNSTFYLNWSKLSWRSTWRSYDFVNCLRTTK